MATYDSFFIGCVDWHSSRVATLIIYPSDYQSNVTWVVFAGLDLEARMLATGKNAVMDKCRGQQCHQCIFWRNGSDSDDNATNKEAF